MQIQSDTILMDNDMNSTLMNHMSTIRRLLRQETESLKSPDHEWKRCQKKSMHNPIWRKMVVEWCYQVIDHVSADRELVYMTMNILDRFVAVKSSSSEDTCQRQNIFYTDKKSYETAVMTSLLITTKIQGIENLDIPDLVTMSSNSVRSKDIIETGKDVIQSLSWNNQVPTAARFAHAFIQLLPQNVPHATKLSVYEDSIDKIELSVQFEAFSRHPPSSVAWMVVENSLDANLVPHDIKSSLREQIHQLGIDYDETLYHHLELLDYRKVPSSGFKLNVIPLDENDDTVLNCIHNISEPRKFSPRSSPLITNVVSLEDMVMISPLPQENDAASKKRHFTEDVAQEIPKLRRISKRHCL